MRSLTTTQRPERITVYSTTWCGDCRLAKHVLDREQADYQSIDIDRDPAAVEVVLRLNGGHRSVPTIVFPDGSVLVEPGREVLTRAVRAGGWGRDRA